MMDNSLLNTSENLTNQVSNNDTIFEHSCTHETYYKVLMFTLLGVVLIPCVVLNSAIIFSYFMEKALRTLATNYFISLAASDLIRAFTVTWMMMYYTYNYPDWALGEIGLWILNMSWCFTYALPLVHLCVLIFYRSIAARSNSYVKNHTDCDVRVLLPWIYAIAVTGLLMISFQSTKYKGYIWNVDQKTYLAFLAIHFTVPLLLCAILYNIIVRKMPSIAATSDKMPYNGGMLSKSRELKVAKTALNILVFLYLVWFPATILEILFVASGPNCTYTKLRTISAWLMSISGFINPILFLSKHSKFRMYVRHRVFHVPIRRTWSMRRKSDVSIMNSRAMSQTPKINHGFHCSSQSVIIPNEPSSLSYSP